MAKTASDVARFLPWNFPVDNEYRSRALVASNDNNNDKEIDDSANAIRAFLREMHAIKTDWKADEGVPEKRRTLLHSRCT